MTCIVLPEIEFICEVRLNVNFDGEFSVTSVYDRTGFINKNIYV